MNEITLESIMQCSKEAIARAYRQCPSGNVLTRIVG